MSPYKLLQEVYYPNDWKIFVCCMMLNQTTGTQVHSIIKSVFKKYPSARSMAKANHAELAEMIKCCGLYNKRASALIRMSYEYYTKSWVEPKELYGLGQYAQESYDIFVRKLYIKSPGDKELKKYVKWKYG